MGSGVAEGEPSQWPAGQSRCRRQALSGLAAPWTGLAAGRPLPHASNERQHQARRAASTWGTRATCVAGSCSGNTLPLPS